MTRNSRKCGVVANIARLQRHPRNYPNPRDSGALRQWASKARRPHSGAGRLRCGHLFLPPSVPFERFEGRPFWRCRHSCWCRRYSSTGQRAHAFGDESPPQEHSRVLAILRPSMSFSIGQAYETTGEGQEVAVPPLVARFCKQTFPPTARRSALARRCDFSHQVADLPRLGPGGPETFARPLEFRMLASLEKTKAGQGRGRISWPFKLTMAP
jgi:hypothetical protein